MKYILLAFFTTALSVISLSQAPFGYYKFENLNYLTKDTNDLISQGGNNDLIWVPNTSMSNGPTGNYIHLSKFSTNASAIAPHTDLGQITGSAKPFGPSASYSIHSEAMKPIIHTYTYTVPATGSSQSYTTTGTDVKRTIQGFSFEYLFRTGEYFGTPILCVWDKVFSIQMYYQSIDIIYHYNDTINSMSSIYTIPLEGMDRKNYNYYTDGNWHHLAITYNNITQKFKLYIDGISPPGFTFGNIPQNNFIGGKGTVDRFLLSKTRLTPTNPNTPPPYDNFDGDIDELAIHDNVLSDEMVLQHYHDMFPNAFASCLSNVLPPTPANSGSYSASTNISPSDVLCCASSLVFEQQMAFTSLGSGYSSATNCATSPSTIHPIDTMEFIPDYTNSSNLISTKKQLELFPYARYSNNSTLHPIVPLFSQMSLQFKENSDGAFGASGQKQFDINKLLVEKYNYAIYLGALEGRLINLIQDPTRYEYKAMEFAKAKPQHLRFLLSNVRHVKDYDTTLLNPNGNNAPHCMKKIYAPLSNFYFTDINGTPYRPFSDIYSYQDIAGRAYDPSQPGVAKLMAKDGASSAKWINQYFNYSQANSSIDIVSNPSMRNNAIDFIFENGEQFLWTGSQNYLLDPTFSQSFLNQPGVPLNLNEFGMKMHLDSLLLPFRDSLLYNPIIHPMLSNTRYTRYDIQGAPAYLGPYKISKGILSHVGYAGKTFPNPFYYPQRQYYWYHANVPGAAAWDHIIKARQYELAEGDDFFAPCVSPGVSEGSSGIYTLSDFEMMRPSSYLAMLKGLAALGADHYLTFAYNMPSPCFPNKSEWNTWQYVMPAYAQAITSRFYDLYKNSTLLPGDANYLFVGGDRQYSFSTGSLADLVVVREEKDLQGNYKAKYAIFGTSQYELYGDSVNSPYSKIVAINLTDHLGNLINKKMKFQIRRQGSVYIYDTQPDLTTAAPQGIKPHIFYQIDKWHERNHPLRWSKDIRMEAEIFDNNHPSSQGDIMEIWTEVPSTISQTANGTPLNGDYSTFTSYMTIYKAQNAFACYQDTSTGPKLTYLFHPTDSAAQDTLYLMLRLRTKANSSGAIITLNSENNLIRRNSISNITSTNWNWYTFDHFINQAVTYENLPLSLHALNIYPQNSDLEIDEVVLTTNRFLSQTQLSNNPCSINDTVSLHISQNTICEGNSVIFNAIPSNGQCVNAPVLYTWDFGNANTMQVPATNNQAISQQFNSAGTYSVHVSLTYANGCKSYDTAYISVNAIPDLTVTGLPNSICKSDPPIALSATPSGGTFTGSGISGNVFDPAASGVGTFTITYSYTDTNACSASINQQITVHGLPVASFTGLPNSICAGTNSYILSGIPGGGIFNGTGISGNTFSPTTVGNYSISYMYTDLNGCSDTSTQLTQVFPRPNLTITSGTTSICATNQVQLNASGATTYSWSPSGTLSNPGIANPIAQPLLPTTYTVMGTHTNSCTNSSTITINVLPTPVHTLGPDQKICAAGQAVILSPNIPYNSQLYSYTWKKIMPGGLQSFLGVGGTYSFTATGNANSTHTYQLCMTNNTSGCTYCDDITFTLTPRPCSTNRENEEQDSLAKSVDFNFEIFPNPAGDNCYIKFNSQMHMIIDISIINQLGQTVKQENNVIVNGGFYNLQLDKLVNGMYYIKLQSNYQMTYKAKILIIEK